MQKKVKFQSEVSCKCRGLPFKFTSDAIYIDVISMTNDRRSIPYIPKTDNKNCCCNENLIGLILLLISY